MAVKQSSGREDNSVVQENRAVAAIPYSLVFRLNTKCIAAWIICCPKSAPAAGIAADQERRAGYDRTCQQDG
jgi:hypothetical protein